MKSIIIRPYRKADLQGLIHCIGQLQDHVGKLDPYRRIRTLKDFDAQKYCARMIQKVAANEGKIFVAEDKGEIVGCIVGVIEYRGGPEDLEGFPSKDGRVLELMVLSSHQKMRLGYRLIETIQDYFTEQECDGCKIECFWPNKSAHAFYKRQGYEERTVYLFKPLRKLPQ